MKTKPQLDDFTNSLALLFSLTDEKAVKLAELLEDRIKELVEDRLDSEFSRGQYRRDY